MRIDFKYPECLLAWLAQLQKLIHADNIDPQILSDFDAFYSFIQGGKMIEEGTSFNIEFMCGDVEKGRQGCTDSVLTREFVFQSEGLFISCLCTHEDYFYGEDDSVSSFEHSAFRIRWGATCGIKTSNWGHDRSRGSGKAVVLSLDDVLAEINQKALATSFRDIRRMVDYEIVYSKSELISVVKKFDGFSGALLGVLDNGRVEDNGCIDLAVGTRNGMLALRFERSRKSNTIRVSARKGIGDPQTYACIWDALEAIPVVWYRSGVRVYRDAAEDLSDWRFVL